ncbi:hypothetical protein ABTX81_30655 [Kitasatospora sp. NPDC097605]|uniref:hypothetical protein n=1 Tax=Kitasatospora sp. NPDC097605 TaxID=3157226 RepID=UPI00332DD329
MPDNLGRTLADIIRRLDVLERAPRGFAGRTEFALEAATGTDLTGSATLTGNAATGGQQGGIALDVRDKDNPAKHGRLAIGPDGLTAQVGDALLTIDPVDGLFTNRPAKFQRDVQVGPGGDLVLGGGSRITSGETWQNVTFNPGFANLAGYKPVQVKRQADGSVKMRGAASLPAGFASGVIGLVPDGYQPLANPEIFPLAAGRTGAVQAFIHPDRRIEVVAPSTITDGFVSFGRVVWDQD